jgi:hypothetical protein
VRKNKSNFDLELVAVVFEKKKQKFHCIETIKLLKDKKVILELLVSTNSDREAIEFCK